jgi:hypothetical protein
MPVFLAKWPNGDCAIATAGNLDKAYIYFDEIGDEPKPTSVRPGVRLLEGRKRPPMFWNANG